MYVSLSLVLVSALAGGGPDAATGYWPYSPPPWAGPPDAGPPPGPPAPQPDIGVDSCAAVLDACARLDDQNDDSCSENQDYGGSDSCDGTAESDPGGDDCQSSGDPGSDDCAAPSGDSGSESCQVVRGRRSGGGVSKVCLLLPLAYLLRRRPA